jgi:hypothetical protein
MRMRESERASGSLIPSPGNDGGVHLLAGSLGSMARLGTASSFSVSGGRRERGEMGWAAAGPCWKRKRERRNWAAGPIRF